MGLNFHALKKILMKRKYDNAIVRYKLSSDRKGLLGYFEDGSYYHIHSNELTQLEEWILKLLEKTREDIFNKDDNAEEIWEFPNL